MEENCCEIPKTLNGYIKENHDLILKINIDINEIGGVIFGNYQKEEKRNEKNSLIDILKNQNDNLKEIETKLNAIAKTLTSNN